MNFLEEKILIDGVIKPGNILKVDSFLNHQIDIDIIRQIAYEFKRRFKGTEVNKVLTIEASGIAIATLLGDLYDVPVVFAKKSETANSTDDKYVAEAYSFTHKKLNNVFISRPYLHATDKVLIVDDFLADGQAAHALYSDRHSRRACRAYCRRCCRGGSRGPLGWRSPVTGDSRGILPSGGWLPRC